MSKAPDIILPSNWRERETQTSQKEMTKAEKKEAAKKAKAKKKAAEKKAKAEKKEAAKKAKAEKKQAKQVKSSDTATTQQSATIEVAPKTTETASVSTFSPMMVSVIAALLAICVLFMFKLRTKNKR